MILIILYSFHFFWLIYCLFIVLIMHNGIHLFIWLSIITQCLTLVPYGFRDLNWDLLQRNNCAYPSSQLSCGWGTFTWAAFELSVHEPISIIKLGFICFFLWKWVELFTKAWLGPQFPHGKTLGISKQLHFFQCFWGLSSRNIGCIQLQRIQLHA